MLRTAAKYLFHSGPGMCAVRWLRRNGAAVLNYHEFRPDCSGALKRQCEYLRRYYCVVPMRQLVEWLTGGAPLPRNAVVITVDDGHRNFYTAAYPLFRGFGFPVTMYLATGFIDSGGWLWFDRLEYAVVHSPLTEVILPANDSGAEDACLSTPLPRSKAQRILLAAKLANRLKSVPMTAFAPALHDLIDAFAVSIPEFPLEEYAPLSWAEVRSMALDGVEFGAHTVSHPILSGIEEPGLVDEEVRASKSRVESELQMPVLHFAYPNGKAADIGLQAPAVVRQAGFRSAVTTISGQVLSGADPFMLNRITVGPEYVLPYFKQRVAAFPR